LFLNLGFVVVADCYCEFFGFPKLSFGLKPELDISSNWPAVFFPDFAGALADFVFISEQGLAVSALRASANI
jgi:hypothetical protein